MSDKSWEGNLRAENVRLRAELDALRTAAQDVVRATYHRVPPPGTRPDNAYELAALARALGKQP